MSLDESDVENEFQIIDASCFNLDSRERGLQFHSNLLCPICESFHANFICQKCITSGSFVHSSDPNGKNYSELCTRANHLSTEIAKLDNILSKSTCTNSDAKRELKCLIDALNQNLFFHLELNRKKRDRQDRLRQLMVRCHTGIHQLAKKRSLLTKHSNAVHQRKKILWKDLEKNSNEIELLRARYFNELLQFHFTIEFSASLFSSDLFAGSALCIDKENIFIGPEPQLSSHAALTYCIPAINAAAVFMGLSLPPPIEQHLQLNGPFLASFPQRDNLGRVYSALIHAVHMICARRGINVPQITKQLGLELCSAQSQYNPLLGLYCLARFKASGFFDAPYAYSLNGLFGELAPRLEQLCLEPIEIGEEVKDNWESPKTSANAPACRLKAGNIAPSTDTTEPNLENSDAVLLQTTNEYESWEVVPELSERSLAQKDDKKLSPID